MSWFRASLLLLLPLGVLLIAMGRGGPDHDPKALYEAVSIGCTETDAVAAAGMPPGDYCRLYDGVYLRWPDKSTRPKCRELRWDFDRGQVVVWINDISGRVDRKEHNPNMAYEAGNGRSLLQRMLIYIGLG